MFFEKLVTTRGLKTVVYTINEYNYLYTQS